MLNISQKWLSELTVLLPFTRNYARRLHASAIARLAGLPQKTVARKLLLWEKLLLLRYEREGKNKYYFLDLSSSLTSSLLQMVECYKEIWFWQQHPPLAPLFQELSRWGVILFGSYAKGIAKKESDLDLVVLQSDRRMLDPILAKYPYTIQVQCVTIQELERKLRQGHPLAKEIVQDHILFGEKEKIIKAFIRYWQK